MNFLLNSDQTDIQLVIEEFFQEKLDFSLQAKQEVFDELRELGFFLMAIPEKFGGLGLGTVSLDLAFRLCGKYLCTLPVQEHLYSLVIPGTEVDLTKLIESKVSTLLLAIGAPNANHCDTLVSYSDKKFEIREIANLSVTKSESMDLSRGYFTVDKLSSEIVATHSNVKNQEVLTDLCICSELCGLAEFGVSSAVSWSKERKQFGKPIGSFQALQHKMADMHVKAEKLSSLTRFAFWCLENDKSQLVQASTSAKILAKKLANEVLEDSIQIHGGIGFTEEHSLHHYLRRSQTLSFYL